MRAKKTVKSATSSAKAVTDTVFSAYHKNWGWFMALGVVLILLGVAAAIYVVPASVVTAMIIGSFIGAGGVVQILHAFTVMRWGQFILWLIAGIVYLAAGVLCVLNPFAALPVLTMLLAALFLIAGIMRMIIGFRVHYVEGAAWIIINGIVTTLLGIIVLVQWPLSSYWTFGILIAIDLIFQGIGWVAYSCGLKALNR